MTSLGLMEQLSSNDVVRLTKVIRGAAGAASLPALHGRGVANHSGRQRRAGAHLSRAHGDGGDQARADQQRALQFSSRVGEAARDVAPCFAPTLALLSVPRVLAKGRVGLDLPAADVLLVVTIRAQAARAGQLS